MLSNIVHHHNYQVIIISIRYANKWPHNIHIAPNKKVKSINDNAIHQDNSCPLLTTTYVSPPSTWASSANKMTQQHNSKNLQSDHVKILYKQKGKRPYTNNLKYKRSGQFFRGGELTIKNKNITNISGLFTTILTFPFLIKYITIYSPRDRKSVV